MTARTASVKIVFMILPAQRAAYHLCIDRARPKRRLGSASLRVRRVASIFLLSLLFGKQIDYYPSIWFQGNAL